MLLTLIIILILIGAAVIGSIYSNFMVFYSNFSESENYHKAYYASISALERGELVTKQRSPGYVGSGGFVMGDGKGSSPDNTDGGSDQNLTGFSYLGDNNDVSSVFRTINSRTTRIPSTGNGDVEQLLAYKNTPNDPENSNNYNMMGYENSEVFLLYYDNSQGNPYDISTRIRNSKPASVKGEIRLPKLLSGFGYLDTSKTLVGRNGDLPKDDAIVDRQIRGTLGRTLGDKPFTIYSTQTTTTDNKVYYPKDSIFRESDINNPLGFNFSDQKKPITNSSVINHTSDDIDKMKVISEYAYNIEDTNFKEIFESSNTKNISLRFSLLNLLKATTNGTTRLYPFLEYYVDFGGQEVSDKYYTINAEGNFKDFQVNTIIQKPTVKETVLGNFTSIF